MSQESGIGGTPGVEFRHSGDPRGTRSSPALGSGEGLRQRLRRPRCQHLEVGRDTDGHRRHRGRRSDRRLAAGFQRRVAVPINTALGNAISKLPSTSASDRLPGRDGTVASPRRQRPALHHRRPRGHEDRRRWRGVPDEGQRHDHHTPQWEWHDHVNDSDETAAWLDVLDLPLVLDTLNASNVFEHHELERQPVTKTQGTGTPSTAGPGPTTTRKIARFRARSRATARPRRRIASAGTR